MWRIDVTDTGTGMQPATLVRASEPFFTTKPPGKGTGLGLAMARGFAEQSGGTLRIQSDEGTGTTVSVWFPRAEAGTEPVPPAPPPPTDTGRPPLRVLMVDDDSMVRDVLANELQDRGFLVTTACDGVAALSLLDAGLETDILVSDYAMPGMNGLQFDRGGTQTPPRPARVAADRLCRVGVGPARDPRPSSVHTAQTGLRHRTGRTSRSAPAKLVKVVCFFSSEKKTLVVTASETAERGTCSGT